MKDLLDKLIRDAPDENDGVVSLQLQIGGQSIAGGVRHSPDYDGLYELLTPGQVQGGDVADDGKCRRAEAGGLHIIDQAVERGAHAALLGPCAPLDDRGGGGGG